MFANLSTLEDIALQKVLRYWAERWDWECPTLFGLSKEKFCEVSDRWPNCIDVDERIMATAVAGAMREFLFGASAVPEQRVHAITGIPRAELIALFEKITPTLAAAAAFE